MINQINENNSNKQIKIGAVISYISIIINIVTGIIYTPWMIKTIGKSNYGLFTLATSLISMFMVDFGISSAVAKFVSQFLAKNDYKSIDNFLGIIYKLYLIIDFILLIIFIIIYCNLSVIYKNLNSEEIFIFKNIFVIIVIFNLFSFPFISLNGILISYERFLELKITNIINKLGTVLSTFFILILSGNIYGLVIVSVCWNIITLFYKLYIVNKKTKIKINLKYWNYQQIKEVFNFSLWTTIISLTSRFIFTIMPSIIASLSGSIQVTIFGIASTLEGYVFTFSDAINGMFLSKTVRVSYSNNRDENMLNLMIKVGRINLSIVALVIILFISSGKEFMLLWMGKDYLIVYNIALLMIIPSLIYCPQQIGRTAMIAEDKIKYQAYIYILVSILNILFALLLCKKYGALGGGISIGIVYSLRLILMSIVFHKKLKINMFVFFNKCIIKMLPTIILCILFGLMIFKYFLIHSWIMLLIKSSLVFIFYICCMWFIVWNKYEKNILKGFIKIKK